MKTFIRFYDKNNEEILGSNGAFICNLKTIRGIKNVIAKHSKPRRAIYYIVYSFIEFYDSTTFKVLFKGGIA